MILRAELFYTYALYGCKLNLPYGIMILMIVHSQCATDSMNYVRENNKFKIANLPTDNDTISNSLSHNPRQPACMHVLQTGFSTHFMMFMELTLRFFSLLTPVSPIFTT